MQKHVNLMGDQTTSQEILDPDDRRKHLDFIQAVVTRMSSASTSAKSWLLPVVTAAYGYAIIRGSRSVDWLGMAAVALFAFLDANYLRQEKAYRRLYDAVARNLREVPAFSLDPSHACGPVPDASNRREKAARRLGRWFPEPSVWISWSIAPFYGGLVITGIAILLTR